MNKYDLVKAESYEYHNGNVIVWGYDRYGCMVHKVFMMYDSLADVKRKMISDGVKNVSHMYKC